MRCFWWGFPSTSRNLTLKSWNSICTLKSTGGLGLRKMSNINQALLSKLGWKFVTSPQSLWVKLVSAKYLKHSSFWDIILSTSSWFWKSILSSRSLLKQGFCHLLRSGTTTKVLQDPRLPSLPHFKPIPKDSTVYCDSDLTVHTLIDTIINQWNRTLSYQIFNPATIRAILMQ